MTDCSLCELINEYCDRDRNFARRVLELEGRQLQRFMRSLQAI